MNCALRVIFVSSRSTGQGEDAVPGALHVAIIMAGSIDHYFQRRVDDRAGLLRIEALLELGRALDVGEKCRDGLALAIQRGIGDSGDLYGGCCWFQNAV